MEKETPIVIRPVENGWIVEEGYNGDHMTICYKKMKVFRSMNELHSFLFDHFEYRGKSLESD